MRWGWPRAQGPGLCFLQLSAGLMCPSCEREGGASCRRALSHSGSLSSLQVMYFSSLFPYVVLACFLVRGLLLRGAVDGILHMFTPKVGIRAPQLHRSVSLVGHNTPGDVLGVRPWRDALGMEDGLCPQGPQERDSEFIWVESEAASGRR